LGKARLEYTQAMQLAQQSETPNNWQVRILHRLADIETQSLNWRKATELYKQICMLRPEDREACSNMVGLFFNLEEPEQALVTMDQYISHANDLGKVDDVLLFLKELVSEQPGQAMIHYRLAMQHERMGNVSGAVKAYDSAGELLLEAGDKAGGTEMIQRILRLDHPEKKKYQNLLESL